MATDPGFPARQALDRAARAVEEQTFEGATCSGAKPVHRRGGHQPAAGGLPIRRRTAFTSRRPYTCGGSVGGAAKRPPGETPAALYAPGAGSDGAPSRSRTLAANSRRSKGLGRNDTPSSSTPRWAITSAV